jgi:hypothetical protein
LAKHLQKSDFKEEEIRNFLTFILEFELPPFIPGVTFKEFLEFVVSDKLREVIILSGQRA